MTIVGPSSDPENTRRFRVKMWLGHFSSQIYFVASSWLAISYVLLVTTNFSQTMDFLLSGPPIAALSFSWFARDYERRVHDKNLCLRDINRPPLLNPNSEVNKRIRTLRTMHNHSRIKFILLGSIVLFVLLTILADVARKNGISGTSVLLVCGFLTNTTASIWHVWAVGVHRKLQPWCPLCRWGKGPKDDDDPEPDGPPEPSISLRKSKVVT